MAVTLEQFGQGLIDPFAIFWNSLMLNVPGLIAAIVIIIFGYFVGVFVGFVVKHAVERVKIDDWLKKTGRSDAIGGVSVAVVSAKLVKWWIFIAFLAPAAGVIQLRDLADMITSFALWAPHLIAGVVIVIAGLIFADFLADSVSHAKRLRGIKAVSGLVRIVTIVFFADIALREIGFNIVLASTTVLMLIGGFIMIFVIGFGIALIKPAQGIIKDILRKMK